MSYGGPHPELPGPAAPALHPIVCVFCPDCPPVRAARELVFGDTFWLKALLMALPFLIVLAVAVAILSRLDRGSR